MNIKAHLITTIAPHIMGKTPARLVVEQGTWSSFATRATAEHLVNRVGDFLRRRDSRLRLGADKDPYSRQLKVRVQLRDGTRASFGGYVGKAALTVPFARDGVMLTLSRGAIGYKRSREGLPPSHAWTFGIVKGSIVRHDTDSANDVPRDIHDLHHKGTIVH